MQWIFGIAYVAVAALFLYGGTILFSDSPIGDSKPITGIILFGFFFLLPTAVIGRIMARDIIRRGYLSDTFFVLTFIYIPYALICQLSIGASGMTGLPLD